MPEAARTAMSPKAAPSRYSKGVSFNAESWQDSHQPAVPEAPPPLRLVT